MPTVSRSVDRVFQLMALFARCRRPLSATEIRETLGLPHSSAISLLGRLVELGYLEQNEESKRFFPSLRLSKLCHEVPDGIACGSLSARVVDAVHARVDETTTLSRLCDLSTLPVYVRTATYHGAHHVTPGCPLGLATQSVTGQTLLSLLSDEALDYFLQRSEYWAKRARVAVTQDAAQVTASVRRAREQGHLCAFNQFLPGVGVVAFALPQGAGSEPLAVSVAGPTEQIRANSEHILLAMHEEIGRFYEPTPLPAPLGEASL
jgi:DNA-binding IclR family transcriptional regulator